METLILLSSPPGKELKRALKISEEISKNTKLALCFLQDAIYFTLKGNLDKGLCKDAEILVIDDDIKLRGYSPDDLLPEVKPIDYNILVSRMMKDNTRVLGCF
ncbi:MAG: DsrH/TusB family sulfur metabolism protein [Nitrospirota bacterium]